MKVEIRKGNLFVIIYICSLCFLFFLDYLFSLNLFKHENMFLLIDSLLLILISIIYRPIRKFLIPSWNISNLFKWKSWLFVFISIFIIFICQYLILYVLKFETATNYMNETIVSIDRILMFITIGILIPIKEEIIFRGILYRHYLIKDSKISAMFASSILFGITHPGYIVTSILMGFVFVILFEKSESLLVSISCHILWNCIVVY